MSRIRPSSRAESTLFCPATEQWSGHTWGQRLQPAHLGEDLGFQRGHHIDSALLTPTLHSCSLPGHFMYPLFLSTHLPSLKEVNLIPCLNMRQLTLRDFALCLRPHNQ